jgi:O-antigen ligase
MDMREYQDVRRIPVIIIIAAGLLIGLCPLFSNLPLMALIFILITYYILLVFPKSFNYLIGLSVILLFCVFIEPSPSDLLFCSLIPLGLIAKAYSPYIPKKAILPLSAFIAYFVLSLPGIIIATDLSSAIRYFLITVYLFGLALFICIYADDKVRINILRAYVIAAILAFVSGFAGFFGLFPELLMADAFRIKGLFKDPNVFGPFMIPAIILLLNDLFKKTLFKVPSPVHIIVIISLCLGIIFSFSRAAWINMIVTLSVYVFLNRRFINKKRFIITVIIILAVLICLFQTPLFTKAGLTDFLQYRARPQHYDTQRFSTQLSGIKLVLENPFGYGPGQFENVIQRTGKYIMSAHSLYIRTAVESGVIAFLFFISAILIILYHTLKTKKTYVYTAIICGLLINSLVVDTLHWRHFWFFLGISLSHLLESEV